MKVFATIAGLALAMATTLTTGAAHADGFKCHTADGDLKIQIFNHTQPDLGTRSVSTMIVSDPNVALGRKTVALFTSAKGTLAFEGSGTYVANVDLRMKESRRAGEYLAGTRLGYVDQLIVDIAHSYGEDTEAGDLFPASLTVAKRNGSSSVEALVCSRYLKAE